MSMLPLICVVNFRSISLGMYPLVFSAPSESRAEAVWTPPLNAPYAWLVKPVLKNE